MQCTHKIIFQFSPVLTPELFALGFQMHIQSIFATLLFLPSLMTLVWKCAPLLQLFIMFESRKFDKTGNVLTWIKLGCSAPTLWKWSKGHSVNWLWIHYTFCMMILYHDKSEFVLFNIVIQRLSTGKIWLCNPDISNQTLLFWVLQLERLFSDICNL